MTLPFLERVKRQSANVKNRKCQGKGVFFLERKKRRRKKKEWFSGSPAPRGKKRVLPSVEKRGVVGVKAE